MYERNAIVLERYFDKMFGYDMKNNIKSNFKDYCELVESLEQYKDISEEEDNIMQEYDIIANKIREIQKKQETLSKRNTKLQSEREEIFQNIDENSETIKKKIEAVNNNIQLVDEQIKENANDFIDVITEFNEKSETRTTCGRARRNIENNYNKALNKILDDYQNIDVEIEKNAKQFISMPTEDIEEELKEKIQKNGEKEKVPFNMEVVTKAIALSVDVQKRETEILANIYDKTNKLFNEIKNNSTKGDRHKKIIRDSKSKLEFVGALKEYLVQFLDNERLTAVNGTEEHDKLMKEACESLDEDLIQINNLYTLLLKEITKKITKKSYSELYNIGYLENLEKKSEEFERQIKKLNLPVTIINPNYWRIEGMRKIYEVFYRIVTEEYGRDLTEYLPKKVEEIEVEDEEDDWDIDEEEPIVEEKKEEKNKKTTKRKIKNITKEDEKKSDIDKKIDMILGFDNKNNNFDDDTYNEDENDLEDDFDDNEEDDDVYYDIWGNDIKDSDNDKSDEDDWEDDEWDNEQEDKEDDEYDDEYDDDEYDEEEYDDEDDEWEDEDEEDNDYDEQDDDWDDEDDEDDEWDDDYDEDEDEEETRKPKTKNKEDDWGNEFINVKEKSKKKKSFFDKFKK